MPHKKVTKLLPLQDFHLYAEFSDGAKRIYNARKLFEDNPYVFQPMLDNPNMFYLAQIDCGGYGIMWSDEIDMDTYNIWLDGIEPTPEEVKKYCRLLKNNQE